MKLLHFLLPSLGNYFTFYKGGGGGGGQSQTQNQLDPTVRPFVEYGLNEAKGLYQTDTPQYYGGQTYISPSAQTTTALNAAQSRALAGNPLLAGAQAQQGATVGGGYLSAGNPYFSAAMRGAGEGATQTYNDAIKAAQSDASRSGRYGSGVSADIQNRAASTLANTLTNKYGEFAAQNYANERALQQQSALNAPALANADYADIQQLMNVGKTAEDYQKTALQADIDRFNFEQNKPYQKLSAYLGAAYGAPTGTVSTTTQSGGGKIVCTAMNKAYGFGSFRQAIWLQHSATMPNAKAIEKGYHKLFLPVVAFAFSDKQTFARKLVRKVSEHIARHRTADLWKEMRGKRRDPLGRIYRAIIEPLCYVAGKVGK
jgi:hypothetical protein